MIKAFLVAAEIRFSLVGFHLLVVVTGPPLYDCNLPGTADSTIGGTPMFYRLVSIVPVISFVSVSLLVGVSVTMSGLGGPALAHHSFAMFDQTQVVSVTGTVTRFDWQNPHAWLYLATEEGGGAAYSFETSSPSSLMSTGWTPDSVQVGDQVEIDFHPLRDGTNGGQLRTIWLPDGTELCNGAECRESYGVNN